MEQSNTGVIFLHLTGIGYYNSEVDSDKLRCIWETLEQPLENNKFVW